LTPPNKYGITFSKKILEDMGYPQNVQYCSDAANHIFAIRACKPKDSRSVPFSKPRSEQTASLVCNNRNLRDVLGLLVPDFSVDNRYAVSGEYDAENHVMYFDMKTAVINEYRQPQKKED
jgi:hypothetical protein